MENLRQRKTDWVRGSCIGRGCFGTVDMAVNKSNGRIFAVKSVDMNSCLAAQAEALENEIKIIRTISSPWVVNYLSDDVTSENGVALFRNLHLEYMPGGTAADLVKDEGILRSHVYCLVAGLKHLHFAGIVHCDIKGRNVLVGSSPNVAKLADFGSARFATHITSGRIVPHGSPLWMAPEVVRGEYQGPESDVWSLGCTVIEMVTGQPAWQDSGTGTLLQIGYSEELPEFPSQLSELGKDFVDKCLRRDRAERWSCDELLRHPFVSSSEPWNPIRHASPRCVLDWTNSQFSENEDGEGQFSSDSIKGRIGKLASNSGAIWDSDGWVEVRNVTSDKNVGTSLEYLDSSMAEMQIHLDTEWVNLEVSHSGDCAEVAVVEGGGDLSCMHGFKGFTAGENILFAKLLFLTAIICTLVWFTIMEILQLLFRFCLRFQSSHVTTLPKLLTLSAVFEIFLIFITIFQNLSKVMIRVGYKPPQVMGIQFYYFLSVRCCKNMLWD